jgi:hypothetical protein
VSELGTWNLELGEPDKRSSQLVFHFNNHHSVSSSGRQIRTLRRLCSGVGSRLRANTARPRTSIERERIRLDSRSTFGWDLPKGVDRIGIAKQFVADPHKKTSPNGIINDQSCESTAAKHNVFPSGRRQGNKCSKGYRSDDE